VSKVLFILKHKHYNSGHHEHDGAGGLLNSSKFVADMLAQNRVESKLVIVTDNNDIDREVFEFRPDIVVIEALWVVPEKFDILKKLHPTVKWIVSLHSNLPFLAHEGVAMEWIEGYMERGVYVAFNAEQIAEDVKKLFFADHVLYLPNYYPVICVPHVRLPGLHIGCFGAIRPMKNQLTQAVAAIEYADKKRVPTMSFHINASRCEHSGSNVLKNLRALFTATHYQLVEHPWLAHEDFLNLMRYMDIEMACSFSETFCITAADAVVAGTPLICSDQIPWAASGSIVHPTDTAEIVQRMDSLINHPWWTGRSNLSNLTKYSNRSRALWLDVIKHLTPHGRK
jgi:hypothetical protein